MNLHLSRLAESSLPRTTQAYVLSIWNGICHYCLGVPEFEQTHDRLDILALDTTGQLVVIELKRDRADDTTDLQAIKYASYCATLTAEDIQRDYRQFWNSRREESLSPEQVGERFASFLGDSIDADIEITSEGWADFDLDDKPRIILLAGSFGIEITAPVMWLIEEYGMEIVCIRIEAYRDDSAYY